MQNQKQPIPWARIAAEGTAIVVSILLAFAIDAMWEHRGDIAEEIEILVGLEAEFVDLHERLGVWAGYNRQGAVLIRRYLSGEAEDMNREDFETMFMYSILANVLDQGGALDALMASGRLERIEDRTIRTHLGKFPDWLEDIHTNDISIREFAWGHVAEYLADQGFPREVCPEGEYICFDDETVPPEYLELASDSKLRALLIQRRNMMWMTARDHENLEREVETLLKSIRTRIELLEG